MKVQLVHIWLRVFFISDKTKNYYSDKGFNKTLDLNSETDSWYESFLNKRLRFDTQVDTDELNDDWCRRAP